MSTRQVRPPREMAGHRHWHRKWDILIYPKNGRCSGEHYFKNHWISVSSQHVAANLDVGAVYKSSSDPKSVKITTAALTGPDLSRSLIFDLLVCSRNRRGKEGMGDR
eukprot:s1718_g15.t1